jgi:hypothetical protein
MFNSNSIRAAVVASVLAIPMAATTSAQPPVVVGGGLVNVQVVDVIDDITVNVEDVNVALGVGLQLAANVCDVAVNVLAEQLPSGSAACDSVVDGTGSYVTITR